VEAGAVSLFASTPPWDAHLVRPDEDRWPADSFYNISI